MKGLQGYFSTHIAFSNKDIFRLVLFVLGYILIAIIGTVLLTGELDITLLLTDTQPLGVGVLFPLVLLYGFPAVLGIFVGQTALCVVSSLLGLWDSSGTFVFEASVLRFIALSIAYLLVTKVKLPHGRFLAGCWIITLINLLGLKLLGLGQILFVWALIWGIMEIDILGFLLLRILSFHRFEIKRNAFALLGGSLAILSTMMPWVANPPGYWFLWGFTLGGGVWIFRARDPILYITLLLTLLGGFLAVLSSNLVQNTKKTVQIAGAFCRAIGMIAFIFVFLMSVLWPVLDAHVTLPELFSLTSFGFITEFVAQFLSLLSLDW